MPTAGEPAAARVPLHRRVADALRAEVDDRTTPAGALLASEAALTERFGVSRSVVRQALAALEAEGRVRRERGRGSVVVDRADHRRLVQRAGGLHDQLAVGGATVSTAVLEMTVEVAPEVAGWLGTAQVLRLERVRSVEGRPVARIRTYLPLPLMAGLREEALTDASLHAVMADLVGVRPRRGSRQVRAVAADEGLAAQLDVAAGDPLLLLEGRGAAEDGTPLEVFATWHRGDAVSFDVEVDDVRARPLVPGDRGRAPAGASAALPAGARTTGASSTAEEVLARFEELRAQVAQLLGAPLPEAPEGVWARGGDPVRAGGTGTAADEVLEARDAGRP